MGAHAACGSDCCERRCCAHLPRSPRSPLAGCFSTRRARSCGCCQSLSGRVGEAIAQHPGSTRCSWTWHRPVRAFFSGSRCTTPPAVLSTCCMRHTSSRHGRYCLAGPLTAPRCYSTRRGCCDSPGRSRRTSSSSSPPSRPPPRSPRRSVVSGTCRGRPPVARAVAPALRQSRRSSRRSNSMGR